MRLDDWIWRVDVVWTLPWHNILGLRLFEGARSCLHSSHRSPWISGRDDEAEAGYDHHGGGDGGVVNMVGYSYPVVILTTEQLSLV